MNDVIAADGDLAIRRMHDDIDDYRRMVTWRTEPHVREWWDPDEPPPTLSGVMDELRPSIGGTDPTTVCVIEVAGRPAGYLQFYPWDAERPYLADVGLTLPEGAWGLDIFIGDPTLVNQGVGSRAVKLISDHLFAEAGATAVALATEAGNGRAQAAYARAGMRPVERFLDTDLRDGQRVESILMIRDQPAETAGGR